MKKNRIIALMSALLLASLSAAQAQTTLADWTFDNLSLGPIASPTPSAGFGTASAIGFGANANPNILSLPGSSTASASPYSWEVHGTNTSPVGNGWSTNATLVSPQGAEFAASTVGYYQIQVTFDVYANTNAEAALQVQYTAGAGIWQNATITSAGSTATLENNSNPSNDIVVGSYILLTNNNGSAVWDNQVTVNLSGISAIDNAAGFAIRIVNASTGTNCLDTTGAPFNGTNGDWTLDNVVIQGVSYDTVAYWPFDNDSSLKKPVNNPPPAISNNTAIASMIGFNTTYTFANNVTGSTNYGDITSAAPGPYSSTGASGPYVWRLRGQNPGNGWDYNAPIGTQGAEFDVSTVNYSNVVVSFDLYFTSQGEAKMCVIYTTNAWATSFVANNLGYGANPTFVVSNTTANPDDVPGIYFYNSIGSLFYNDVVIDFTGVAGVSSNANFGFRIVNAATGPTECVNYLGQTYNNSSGNARLDNVAVSGQYEGLYAPTITNSSSATVDAPFTNTFALNAGWAAAVKSIYVNGTLLTNTAYTITSSNIVFNPSKSVTLQLSGLDSIVIYATGYTSAKISQFVQTGVAKKLVFTQPSGPSASSGTLMINPVFEVTDQYGNGTTNPYVNLTVTASSGNPAAWTLGGSAVQTEVNGSCTFTDLTATVTGSSAVPTAAINFTVTGYTNTSSHSTTTNFSSTSFTIGKPPVFFTPGNLAVLQIDLTNANTTFSIAEIQPSTVGQTAPANLVPITATGTNGLRLSSAGSCGKLALSDDGTFLVFDAFQDSDAATPDETFNQIRAVGTLNYTNLFTMPVSYVSQSLGGSQARAACSPDNVHFLICDKGGLYVDSSLVYVENNLSTRSFAGATWVETAKVATPPTPAVFQFANGGANSFGSPNDIDWGDAGDNGPVNQIQVNGPNPPPDAVAQDFYMLTSNGVCAVMYIADQNSGTNGSSGVITKWTLEGDGVSWADVGSWTNSDNCDTLFATTNGSGSVYLYYANGSGGTSGNQIIRVTDQTLNGPLNITSTNVIYTAAPSNSVEGIVFVPQLLPYTNDLVPAPILVPQYYANTNAQFSITNLPDDPTWRQSITAIKVNGSPLPQAAYNTNIAGVLVFDPSQSALLQVPGVLNFAITATGYSTNYVNQTIAGAASQIVITTQPKAPAADGGVLTNQPVVALEDPNGNLVANSDIVTAGPVQGTWMLGGVTNLSFAGGPAAFNLTAFANSAVTGATITFTSSGLTSATSSSFNIAAPIHMVLGGLSLTNNGGLSFSFTNATGLGFSVLGTNNVSAPVNTWPYIGPAVETPAGSGIYVFTNSTPATGDLFYILRQP